MSTTSSQLPRMLRELLSAEKANTRVWLRAEMDRLVDPLVDSVFARLTNKLMVKMDLEAMQSDGVRVVDRIEREVKREIKEENEATLQNVMDNAPEGNEQIGDCVKLEIKEEEEEEEAMDIKEEDEEGETNDVTEPQSPNLTNRKNDNEDQVNPDQQHGSDGDDDTVIDDGESAEGCQDSSRPVVNEPMDTTPPTEEQLSVIAQRCSSKVAKWNQTEEAQPNQVNIRTNRDVDDAGEGTSRSAIRPTRYEAIRSKVGDDNETMKQGDANLDSEEQMSMFTANQSTVTTESHDLFAPSTSTGHGSNRNVPTQRKRLANHNNIRSVSNQPSSTSARPQSNRTSKQAPTVSTRQNELTQRTQPDRTGKRAKITLEEVDDDEEEEDSAKMRVIYLHCTESNCTAKLDSLVALANHLRSVHQLSPLRCYATNCTARFDKGRQIQEHLKLHHSQGTQFRCPSCRKEFGSQIKTNRHWYLNHQNGKFQCNLVPNCAAVAETRIKLHSHQKATHHNQSKPYHCAQPGCSASFANKTELKKHKWIHLNRKAFHCTWEGCRHSSTLRENLIKHIRTQHFGLPKLAKEQKEKNIVDERDPSDYVRLVEE